MTTVEEEGEDDEGEGEEPLQSVEEGEGDEGEAKLELRLVCSYCLNKK